MGKEKSPKRNSLHQKNGFFSQIRYFSTDLGQRVEVVSGKLVKSRPSLSPTKERGQILVKSSDGKKKKTTLSEIPGGKTCELLLWITSRDA